MTTPAGLRRKPIGWWRENSSVTERPTTEEMPAIGRMKYSIIPLVSGWLMSKRYSSPSVGRSIPAWRWRSKTTRVASITACSLGRAASHSGTG